MAKKKKSRRSKRTAGKLSPLDRIDLRYKRARLAEAKKKLRNAKLEPAAHKKVLEQARELQAGINRLTAREGT